MMKRNITDKFNSIELEYKEISFKQKNFTT